MATTKKVQLPEGFDPYDMRLKRQFSDQADKMNVIALSRKNYNLCCGAHANGLIDTVTYLVISAIFFLPS